MIRSLRLDDETILEIGETAGEQELARHLQDFIKAKKELEKTTADSADLTQKLQEAQGKITAITTERDQQQARADMAEGELTKLKETHADADAIKAAFEQGKARAALEKQIAEITGTAVKADASDRDLKIAAIASKLKVDAAVYADKSEAYVDAAFDLAMATDVTGLQRASVNTPSAVTTDAKDMPMAPEKKKLRYSKAG